MSSQAQIAANQTNAQRSTGPVTPEGKAAVAQNALKTGLTGRTVLLPADDAELYAAHLESFRSRYSPLTDEETELVQSIVDTAWRLARIPNLEAGIYAIGRTKLAESHANEKDAKLRSVLIDADVYLAYERQLRNLHTQESRLRRHMDQDMAKLKEIQDKRKKERESRMCEAGTAYLQEFQNGDLEYFEPAEFGFEFAFDEIDAYARKKYKGVDFGPRVQQKLAA